MTWSLGAVTGAGAAHYAVSVSPPPGLLSPGATAVVTVVADAVASPALDPSPAAFDAQLTIATDVPLDSPHVVALGTTPVGDQLSFSVDQLRFGQIPVGTSLAQSFAVTNRANPGSPSATFALVMTGAGAGGYAVAPGSASNVGAGAVPAAQTLSFAPTSAVPYPAGVAIATSDPLCTPLPSPLVVSGTGTTGKVLVSASTLAFGADASDPKGLVACGATGLSRALAASNVGNQETRITGLTLAKGAASPFTVASASLPIDLPIHGAATWVVAPRPIPSAVADPGDASAFSDTLTIATDAADDPSHAVTLVMQPRGSIVLDAPVAPSWTFGTIGFGSIGTFTTTIRNAGNAPASITLDGLALPGVFGLQSSPTTALGGAVTSIVGQFAPPSANGSWTDHGTLSVVADALCAPIPASWSAPSVVLSGASNGAAPVSIAGSLAFPSTSCGDGPPSAQEVTLTNATNVAYSFAAALHAGVHYSLGDTGSGTLLPNGAASIVVTPSALVPGATTALASAPYDDDLIIEVATSPPTAFTVPVRWALEGAVFTLPQGAGPQSDAEGAYYLADSSGAFVLPMENGGTATATVSFAVSPASAASVAPSSPLAVAPGGQVSPQLIAGPSAPACPTTATATLTFFYSGPVCQPFPFSSVKVHACSGAL
jgi:hypothetical protein